MCSDNKELNLINLKLNLTMNFSATLLNISSTTVEFPIKIELLLSLFDKISKDDYLILF